MRPNRLMIMLGGCLVAGSAACADELGFVDCASHNDTTPVFAKARKSQDIVANVACGERFKVIVYGFVFSEIQTSDGKLGFIYSNVVTVDRAGGTLQTRAASTTTPTLSAASDKTKIYAEPRQSTPPAPAQAAPAPVTPAAPSDSASAAAVAPPQASATPSQPPANAVSAQATSVEAQLNPPAAPAARKPAPAPASLPGPESVLKATSTSATSAEAPVNANAAPPVATPTAAPAAPATPPAAADAPGAATPAASAPTSASAPAPTAVADSMPKPDATAATNAQPEAPAAQPQPPPDAQPQPAPPAEVQPGITPGVTAKQRWEKPNPGARSASLLELYGGFAFASMSNGSGYTNATNFMGGMGAFGVNLKPWIQITGDTSYSFQTPNGVKTVVYGNHYGPRFFLRGRSKWSISPFGEVLVGGSRADTNVPATPGYAAYTTSQNCFSIKAGGGVDIRPSRMFEIRLVDVDYYRTAFGTNIHQSNYWVSTGVVIRLLKPWWE